MSTYVIIKRHLTKLLSVFVMLVANTSIAQKPSIIVILTDDMGYGDLSCYNGIYQTPQLDKMAAEGIRFTNYYSASPVCSPSRAGLLTGVNPSRWNITNYLSDKKHNINCEQKDFLSPAAPSIARLLQNHGYATAHFGKWHMGGGRDVTDAPSIKSYGFDEWSSTWESPDPDPLLTDSNWIWSRTDSVKRWNRTAYFVDKTIAFLQKNKNKPCYINLWPDDVHTPWVNDESFVRGEAASEKKFADVLQEYDRQIGRLLNWLRQTGMDKNTVVVFTSDNGPAPNFRQDRSVGMRGAKLSLYEAGIKMPFIVWGYSKIAAGKIDSTSVIGAVDLLKSFASLAGITGKKMTSDGEDISTALLGRPIKRNKELYWEYGRNSNHSFKYPAGKNNRSPQLAVRDGQWKLLMNIDGSDVELYNVEKDKMETKNLASEQIAITVQLKKKIIEWWNTLPLYK